MRMFDMFFYAMLWALLHYGTEILCVDVRAKLDFREESQLFAEMKSEFAVQGPCWVYAVERFEEKRKEPESQERLAFDFTNCFIEGAGVEGYFCKESQELITCEDFVRMQAGPHRHVYSVHFLQSQLLLAYLKELAHQRQTSRQLESSSKNTRLLSSKLATTSDLLLDSLKTEGEIAELKRLAVKSHAELRENLQGAERVFADLVDLVTQYKIIGVTTVGMMLYVANFVIGRVF